MTGEDIIVSFELMKHVQSNGHAGKIARGKYKLNMGRKTFLFVGAMFWVFVLSLIALLIF